MPSNLAQFNAEVERVAKDLPAEQVRLLQKKLTFEALSRVVNKTPVDTGRARGNWQVSVGSPAIGEKLSADPIGQGLSALGSLGDFDVVYLTNNVPYITVLEYGEFVPPDPGPSKDKRRGRQGRILVAGGFSTQAPRGMLSVTIEELLTIFR